MKKQLLGISAVVALSLLSAVAVAEPMYGVMMVVKGSVKVQNASKQSTDAKVGSKVAEGDTIITGADSRAKVVMSDRNVINVNPDTQVTIAKYENDAASGKKNVEMNLLQGKVRNNVEQTYDGEKNKFLIKTPTAVAGVRGTQFLAGFNPATRMTSIVTFKGAVSLASMGPGGTVGAPVIIKKGQMTTASPNAAPEPPKALPKEEMKQIDGDSIASLSPGAGGGGEAKREIASEAPASAPTSAPSMVDSKDMDMGMAKEIKDVRTTTSAATTTAPPTLATPPPPKATPIIPPSATGGKTRVNVRPITPSP